MELLLLEVASSSSAAVAVASNLSDVSDEDKTFRIVLLPSLHFPIWQTLLLFTNKELLLMNLKYRIGLLE